MKLDKRFEVLPFCCFSAEKCDKYIGQKGYFTNNIDFFKKIDLCVYGTLEEVYVEQADSFQMDNRKFFRYFIPEYFVKPKEKQYRPFDPVAFEQHYGVGCVIKFRNKGEKHLIYKAVISAIVEAEDPKEFYVLLGYNSYTFGELFERYEMCEYGEWVPFGLKVEEEK